mmetsp:Transcript_9575/g.18666  ORF Transcript_9575/g.18666 Transcript_9575/m.18666 type:complete len:168 (+) Transcript_9575:414-917(+)
MELKNRSLLLSRGFHNARSEPIIRDVNWKSCKYYSNSGISNPVRTTTARNESSSESLPFKPYHVNTESNSGWDPVKVRGSMINYQRTNYDPITHVATTRPHFVSAHRIKGLSEFYDRANKFTTPVNTQFNTAIKTAPSTFHRKVGEFTAFHDSCRKHTNHAPFVRRF